ncbi:MAG: tetraacyldisaccharide 4-kinase [Mucilaginibacter sp.]|nr:tetraacyldisaccharide 4-kinase [Mucilaginibacter sp.]
MKYLRWLLFPFSLLYGLVVIIRNWCYDSGVFKSYKFNKPIISVGNLDVGGAGKSPMTEYLIRLLKTGNKLATLSRGYGRDTKGYLEADVPGEPPGVDNNLQPATHNLQLTTARQIGDEPAQFKHKFPDITVAVCEKRVEGIKKLLPAHDLILLDDAYQHRAVEPGLSILLFDYNRIHEPHLLLPAGNLREPFSGRWRAQIIIVTKCPPVLTTDEQAALAEVIEPLPYQQLFFTSITYQHLHNLEGQPVDTMIDSDTTIFLLTGIANAQPLLQHLSGLTSHIIHHNYPDHHPFSLKNITKLADVFSACESQKKIIVTTEKDAQRLDEFRVKSALPAFKQLPIFVIPIRVEFLNGTGHQFDQLIIEYVRQHTTFHHLH